MHSYAFLEFKLKNKKMEGTENVESFITDLHDRKGNKISENIERRFRYRNFIINAEKQS